MTPAQLRQIPAYAYQQAGLLIYPQFCKRDRAVSEHRLFPVGQRSFRSKGALHETGVVSAA